MIFKDPGLQDQLAQSPPHLTTVANYFDQASKRLGVQADCTRVWEHICGDSGVHEAHRAVDFRDETRNSFGHSQFLYSAAQVQMLVAELNEQFPRKDGKLTCIHHSFQNGPFHFHLQIGPEWAGSKEA